MERADICDGDTVGVDFTRHPKPGRRVDGKWIEDACLCFGAMPTRDERRPDLRLMVKSYAGKWGPRQMVGTSYTRKPGKVTMDCAFEPIEIFGVVFAAWDSDGNLKWEIDMSDYPEEYRNTVNDHRRQCRRADDDYEKLTGGFGLSFL